MACEDEMVVCIRGDGTVEFLYDERLGIEGLGHRTVRRASHVEVPSGGQDWEARCASTGRLIARDVSRARCLEAERAHFHQRLERGWSPFVSDPSAPDPRKAGAGPGEVPPGGSP